VDPFPELGDHLARHDPAHFHRALKAWSAALRRPYVSLLWQAAIRHFVPGPVRMSPGTARFPPWFDPHFVTRMKLEKRYLRTPDIFGCTLPSKRDQAAGFLSAAQLVSRAPYRSRGCIEVSHPYLDRPLVEFLQAIPHEQLIRAWQNRSLMRRALRGVVPEAVLTRKTKRYLVEPLLRALIREWAFLQSIFADARVVAYGYVDQEVLLQELNRARNGCDEYVPGLTALIPLEFWLRAVEARASAPKTMSLSGEYGGSFTLR